MTERELAIITLVCEGKTNKELARHFELSEKTIKNHLYRIYRKLKVNNRISAAFTAFRTGLVPLSSLTQGEPENPAEAP